MTPAEAAAIIGCSATQVRVLIRKGKIKATKQEMPGGQFCYDILVAEARRYRDTPQKQGWPRGQSYELHEPQDQERNDDQTRQ